MGLFWLIAGLVLTTVGGTWMALCYLFRPIYRKEYECISDALLREPDEVRQEILSVGQTDVVVDIRRNEEYLKWARLIFGIGVIILLAQMPGKF